MTTDCFFGPGCAGFVSLSPTMNSTAFPPPASASTSASADLIQDNNIDSDSDTNPDDAPEYYQPISAEDDRGDGDSDSDGSDCNILENGYHTFCAEDGISSLGINDGGKSSSDEEEEEEVRVREASDSAIVRAFREDESRRSAPLTAENAMRVMEAMRGVSFGGSAPDWAGTVAEDQWTDRLRRLRQQPQRQQPSPSSHQQPSTSLQN